MGKRKKKKKIRPLALCVFRREDQVFVSQGYDAVKDHYFYRPIGGGIEFGETAIEAVQREVMEEINAVVTDLVYLGTLENIFTYEGLAGHEICLILDGRFADDARNQDDYTVIGTDDDEILYTAFWKPLSFFVEGHAPLYPQGLLDLLLKISS
ncbi:MAG: NUDIX domain-containing protein [Phototrophicaceae bacterium]